MIQSGCKDRVWLYMYIYSSECYTQKLSCHDMFYSLQLALKNALRYFPSRLHKTLAGEFATELEQYGHIYMYRFLPPICMK